MAYIDTVTHVDPYRGGMLYRDLGVVHRPNDRLKTRSIGRLHVGAVDKSRIEYRGYTSARGSVMLDVVVDGQRRYRFGPFENRQQRMVLLLNLRATAASSTKWR